MDVTDICHQAWKVCCQEARQSLERLKNEHLATLVPGKQDVMSILKSQYDDVADDGGDGGDSDGD